MGLTSTFSTQTPIPTPCSDAYGRFRHDCAACAARGVEHFAFVSYGGRADCRWDHDADGSPAGHEIHWPAIRFHRDPTPNERIRTASAALEASWA